MTENENYLHNLGFDEGIALAIDQIEIFLKGDNANQTLMCILANLKMARRTRIYLDSLGERIIKKIDKTED